MCLNYVKIKKTTKSGISYAYVPCGKCADCRRKAQDGWKFRLYSEFLTLKKQGWNVGFLTLTYDEDSLPLIPEECFKDKSHYRDVVCFDKSTVREWINNVRHYCKYHYGFTHDKSVRYFVTSEYGSNTHRPHYHAILAWSSEMSYEEMHSVCKHYWTKGLVGPKTPHGDRNCQSFEVVGDATHALSYVAKYVTKDVDYVDTVADLSFYDNPREYADDTDEHYYAKMYRNCVPFHIQSQSLGMEAFKSLSDEDKQDVLLNGMQVTGDDCIYQAPVYVRNKFVFDNYYVYDPETKKRLCRRRANGFFEANREEIFERKAQYWTDHLTQMDRGYLESAGVDSDLVDKMVYALEYRWKLVNEHCGFDMVNDIGKYYLAYNAVQSDRCFAIPLVEQWMLRYRDPAVVEECIALEKWPEARNYELAPMRLLWDLITVCYSYVDAVKLEEREEKERLNKKILDYFNVCVNNEFFSKIKVL